MIGLQITRLTTYHHFYFTDGSGSVVVLLCENRGVAGHSVLCSAKEEQTDLVPASLPSHHDAHLRVDWNQISTWYVVKTTLILFILR